MNEVLAYGLATLVTAAILGRLAFHLVRMFSHNDQLLRELVETFTLDASPEFAFDKFSRR